jgi:hypothetical protein
MAAQTNNVELPDNSEIPENFNVGEFLFTRKTITYDDKTIQLSNVTKLSKYSYKETLKAVYKVSEDLLSKATMILVGSGVLLYLLSKFEGIASILRLILVGALAVVAYGYYERNKKKDIDKKYYGLIIETSSGKSENLLTNSKDFIWSLFDGITRAMNDDKFTKIIANFTNHDITYYDNSENVHGDKYSNINSSTINNRSQI